MLCWIYSMTLFAKDKSQSISGRVRSRKPRIARRVRSKEISWPSAILRFLFCYRAASFVALCPVIFLGYFVRSKAALQVGWKRASSGERQLSGNQARLVKNVCASTSGKDLVYQDSNGHRDVPFLFLSFSLSRRRSLPTPSPPLSHPLVGIPRVQFASYENSFPAILLVVIRRAAFPFPHAQRRRYSPSLSLVPCLSSPSPFLHLFFRSLPSSSRNKVSFSLNRQRSYRGRRTSRRK